uniref:oleoyl-[acyl-carrier-protein] hydrolase n=1 Tax=Timema bartmani TaxID=61472 RepID=A0A7R9F653_9NEOP|nr:unnamed protein product [Timema bartmani]
MEENTSIGMSVFLKHVAVLGIAIDNIFNASLAWKKELHSAIKEGIKLGIVQPLGKVLFTEQQTLEALRELSNCNNVRKVLIKLMGESQPMPKNKSVINKIKATSKTFSDLKNSHIIIGSKFEDCLCVAEWLVTHKANKITIAAMSQKLSVLSERRMFLLRRYHNAHIIQTSAEKIYTLPGARRFIRNASNLGTVTTIFSIALNDATSLHNLDVASRSLDSLTHFVSLMDKSGEDVSKERFKEGLPILDVQWTDSQKSVNIRPILKVMDRLLSSRSPPFINVSLEDKLIKYTNEDEEHPTGKDGWPLVPYEKGQSSRSFLPSNLDELEAVGFDFLSKAKRPLVVTPSLSPGIGRVPEVPPIFIVPGIQNKTEKVLETLTNKIMYPTICINLQDHNMSLSKSAENIVKHMRNIQPVGPYNLVGVSWGGILTLELARELQSQDQKIQLFLLDGAPDTTQSIAKLLGTGDDLHCNLITKLLGIESNKHFARRGSALNKTNAACNPTIRMVSPSRHK